MSGLWAGAGGRQLPRGFPAFGDAQGHHYLHKSSVSGVVGEKPEYLKSEK